MKPHAYHHRSQPSNLLHAVLIGALMLQIAACREPSGEAAQALPSPASMTVFSATLREALSQRARTLTARRTALPLTDGTTANDCESYLKARKAGAQIPESVDAQLVASEYLICEAVDLLSVGQPSASKQPDALGSRLAKQLDLRTFPSSLGPQLDAERITLAALSDAVKTDAVTATLEDESSTTRFEVVAEADLDRDGKLDWVVWMADESRDGNYRGYATLLISDAAATVPLKAKTYPATG